jgi:very-short-patch-repair endonuclease
MPHTVVSDRQRSRAKSLRLTMTRAETLLWRYIKAGHIDGLQFRRQSPMGAYIVDFVCHAAKLVIEVDGSTHDFESRLRQDQIRDRWLASRGYKVLRFTNHEVLSTLEGVVTVIHEAASQRLKAPPSLSLPRKGGGNPQTSTARDAAQRRAPSLPSPASGGGGVCGMRGVSQ